MKMSNFENPTWRTAAILKIVIAPYISWESSEFDEIWYADENLEQDDRYVTKIQKFPNSRWRMDAILKINVGYKLAPYCPIKTKIGMRRHNRTHTTVRWWKCPISKIQHGRRPPFWKSLYFHIWAANRPNCTKCSMQTQILSQATETTKNRNSQIQNGGWSGIKNHSAACCPVMMQYIARMSM